VPFSTTNLHAQRRAHQHQKPMMTWQKWSSSLKWQMLKTPGFWCQVERMV